MKKVLLCILIISDLCFSTEKPNLVSIDLGGIINGSLSLDYQRIISEKHSIGIIGRINTDSFHKPKNYSCFLGYDFYSKQAFKGLWILAHTGLEKRAGGEYKLPIVAGLGYRWELPANLTIGICFAPGVSIPLTSENKGIGFAYLCPVDFGFKF
jgi:hypothetical protein